VDLYNHYLIRLIVKYRDNFLLRVYRRFLRPLAKGLAHHVASTCVPHRKTSVPSNGIQTRDPTAGVGVQDSG
jgi:hypothetical protein